MANKSTKRNALIDVAKKLIYQQGFNVTTLVDIAFEADVPLGNIYCYFKAKNDIGMAVLDSIATEQKVLFEQLEREPSPLMRLRCFLEDTKKQAKSIAFNGSLIGTLCEEFGKEGGILVDFSAKIMMDFLLWTEAQFCALGLIEEASNLSLGLVCRLQGIFLLGYAFKDPNLITRQITLLQDSLKEQIAECKCNSLIGSTT